MSSFLNHLYPQRWPLSARKRLSGTHPDKGYFWRTFDSHGSRGSQESTTKHSKQSHALSRHHSILSYQAGIRTLDEKKINPFENPEFTVLEPHKMSHSFNETQLGHIAPTTAVEDILGLYKSLWLNAQSKSEWPGVDAAEQLLKAFKSVDAEFRDHCIKRGFESLLLFALENPCSIDFLIQTCWQAMQLMPEERGEDKFLRWADGLPIVPQPVNPVLGDPQFMTRQAGAVKTSRAKRSARLVTAGIMSRCIAFGILGRSQPTAKRCHLNETACLKGEVRTDEVDFVAACIFFRGCAQTWSVKPGEPHPGDLIKIREAILQDWRYHSNLTV